MQPSFSRHPVTATLIYSWKIILAEESQRTSFHCLCGCLVKYYFLSISIWLSHFLPFFLIHPTHTITFVLNLICSPQITQLPEFSPAGGTEIKGEVCALVQLFDVKSQLAEHIM